jgi:hypothetical protein
MFHIENFWLENIDFVEGIKIKFYNLHELMKTDCFELKMHNIFNTFVIQIHTYSVDKHWQQIARWCTCTSLGFFTFSNVLYQAIKWIKQQTKISYSSYSLSLRIN